MLPGEHRYAAAFTIAAASLAALVCAIALALGYPNPAPCYEDQPCWDCQTMGNGRCGP